MPVLKICNINSFTFKAKIMWIFFLYMWIFTLFLVFFLLSPLLIRLALSSHLLPLIPLFHLSFLLSSFSSFFSVLFPLPHFPSLTRFKVTHFPSFFPLSYSTLICFSSLCHPSIFLFLLPSFSALPLLPRPFTSLPLP